MKHRLYYAHDPMCSWCYAFKPALNKLIAELPTSLEIIYYLGGLAPDTDESMPEETRVFVQSNWQRIEEQVTNTEFNYAFWTDCQPRRSTYPACRAVIAARQQGTEYDLEMIWAIQNAYYRQARNPSELSTLIELAEEIGLDKKQFSLAIGSLKTDEVLRQEIKQTRRLGLNSFPSLLLETEERRERIDPDYNNVESMLQKINQLLQ